MSGRTYTSESLDPKFCKDMLEKIKDLCLDPAMKQMVSDTVDKMKEDGKSSEASQESGY